MVSGRRCEWYSSPGVWLYFILVLNSYQDSLKHVYDLDLSLSLTVSLIFFQPGYVSPAFNPLSSSSSSNIVIPCLSHSCPHLMFFFSLQIHHLCLSSCRPFCFLTCNVPRHISYIHLPAPTSSWFDSYYITPTSFMLTSSPIHPQHVAHVYVYVSFFPFIVPGLIVILPSSLLLLPVHVLFIGLVSIIVVFRTTHAHVSIFVTDPRTVNPRFHCTLPRFAFYA